MAGSEIRQQVTFMCDDLATTIRELSTKGISFKGEAEDWDWGIIVMMVLPGGVEVMRYPPRHASPGT